MQATINTMFVNERLSEYIYFVHSQHETQDKCILRELLRQNPVIPPP